MHCALRVVLCMCFEGIKEKMRENADGWQLSSRKMITRNNKHAEWGQRKKNRGRGATAVDLGPWAMGVKITKWTLSIELVLCTASSFEHFITHHHHPTCLSASLLCSLLCGQGLPLRPFFFWKMEVAETPSHQASSFPMVPSPQSTVDSWCIYQRSVSPHFLWTAALPFSFFSYYARLQPWNLVCVVLIIDLVYKKPVPFFFNFFAHLAA
jgi:hypothetical protein